MQLDLNRNRFNRMTEQFFLHFHKKNFREAIKWAKIAGSCAWYTHPGIYVHQEVEEALHYISGCLSSNQVNFSWNIPKSFKSGRRWLHVLSSAYTTGGHTRLAERWMLASEKNDIHSFILLDQDAEIPQWLVTAAQNTGGTYIVLPYEMNLLTKAQVLREIATQWADIIILSTHPNDPISSISFGIPDGPPVLLINHAAFGFWIGAGISDVVFDLWKPEQNLTIAKRKTRENQILHLPIHMPKIFNSKEEYKSRLGIPKDAVLMLASAASYKFLPYRDRNFTEAMVSIINSNTNVYMLVLGADPNLTLFKQAMERTKGKFRVCGLQKDITTFYGAADLFIESFPFSSYTSCLEAASLGIPIIPAPMPISPNVVLGYIEGKQDNPSNMGEYFDLLQKYIDNKDYRIMSGQTQKKVIEALHMGEGWKENLRNIIFNLPKQHKVGFTSLPSDAIDYTEYDHFLADIQIVQGNLQGLKVLLNRLQNAIY